MLSPTQIRILQVIEDYTRTTGRSPSIRTIAAQVGLRSAASVHSQLQTLEERGYVRRVSDSPRIMEVDFAGAWTGREDASSEASSSDRPTADRSIHDGLTTRQKRILEVIRNALKDRGYAPSIREIAHAVGLTSTSSVHSQLETLERKQFIRRDPATPRAIELLRKDSPEFRHGGVEEGTTHPIDIPLLRGPIAAGIGILPDDAIEMRLPFPRELVGEGEMFMLQVRGDSLIEAGIYDRDFVIVRRQSIAENGDLVAALLPNFEAEVTVKILCRKNGHVKLMPANPRYMPIDGDEARILGKVITVVRRL